MTEASSKTPMASVLKRTDEASPDDLVSAGREDICDLQLAAPASPRQSAVAMITVGIISSVRRRQPIGGAKYQPALTS